MEVNAASMQLVIALGAGLIVALVSGRVFREYSSFGWTSWPIAVCGGVLAAIGLSNSFPGLTFLCIPWMALAAVMPILWLAKLFFGRTSSTRCPELAGKKGGQSVCKSPSPRKTPKTVAKAHFPVGSLLPAEARPAGPPADRNGGTTS